MLSENSWSSNALRKLFPSSCSGERRIMLSSVFAQDQRSSVPSWYAFSRHMELMASALILKAFSFHSYKWPGLSNVIIWNIDLHTRSSSRALVGQMTKMTGLLIKHLGQLGGTWAGFFLSLTKMMAKSAKIPVLLDLQAAWTRQSCPSMILVAISKE